jgi:hypothetical protein
MMKRLIIVAIAILALAACVQKRFERVCETGTRYDIVYIDEKCGVFDSQADSLVTACDYDSISFLKRADEDSVAVVLFSCRKDGMEGMLGVLEQNNETMQVMFPSHSDDE